MSVNKVTVKMAMATRFKCNQFRSTKNVLEISLNQQKDTNSKCQNMYIYIYRFIKICTKKIHTKTYFLLWLEG